MTVPPGPRGAHDLCVRPSAHEGGRVDPVGSKRACCVPRADSPVTIHVNRGAVQWQGWCQPGLQGHSSLDDTCVSNQLLESHPARWCRRLRAPTPPGTSLYARSMPRVAGLGHSSPFEILGPGPRPGSRSMPHQQRARPRRRDQARRHRRRPRDLHGLGAHDELRPHRVAALARPVP
jgi:hypothetical protein